MKLVVVSNPVPIVEEAVIINSLFASGLKHFHLRKPSYCLAQIQELILGIKDEYYQRISLHQFHEIASDFGVNRLHFTEQIRRKTTAEKLNILMESGYILSTSIHSLTDLGSLKGFKSTFYSPVFDSISKPGYRGVVATDFKYLKRQGTDLIALGGVTAENIKHCMTMNFDGAAVLGTIWNDPRNAVKSFRNIMKAIND